MDSFNLTPEDLELLISLGVIDDEKADLERQYAAAEALRNTPAPEGRYVRGIYVAASPLEHLARVVQGFKAQEQMDELRNQQSELRDRQIAGRRRFAELMFPQDTPEDPTLAGMRRYDEELARMEMPRLRYPVEEEEDLNPTTRALARQILLGGF